METIEFKIITSGTQKMIITDDVRYRSLNTPLFPGVLLYSKMNSITFALLKEGKKASFTMV